MEADKDQDTFNLPDFTITSEPEPVDRVSTNTLDAMQAAFLKDTHFGQLIVRGGLEGVDVGLNKVWDINYNPFTDPNLNLDDIDPSLFGEIAEAYDHDDAVRIQLMANANAELEERLQGHGLARFMTNLADPYNLIPVPMALGRGFVQGFKRTFLPNAGIVTAAEMGRTSLDPTDTVMETAANITLGTLLASGIGGAFGMIPYTPHDVGLKVHAAGSIREYFDSAGANAKGPSLRELALDDVSWERIKTHLPEGVTRQDVLRGTADDGLGNVIRFQALRQEGQEFGDQIILRSDPDGDWVMLRNGELELRGTKADLVKAADVFGTQRVKNFASREALMVGETDFKNVHPDAPDPKLDPEGYNAYVEGQVKAEAPKDADGVTIPDHNGYFNRHTMRELMDLERQRLADHMDSNAAEIGRLHAERDMWKRRIAHPNQHYDRSTSQSKLEEVEAQITTLDSNNARTKEALDDVENRIDLAEQSNNPADYMLEATGLGVEKLYAKSGVFPWHSLTQTDLVKLAPDLAPEWQRIAFRLAGSPGLMYKGGSKGVGVGTSAEMQATQWWHPFREAKSKMDRDYAKLYGYGDEGIGPVQQEIMEAKEDVVELGRKARIFRKADQDRGRQGQGMSFSEYRMAVGRTLSNGGKVLPDEAKHLDPDTIAALESSAVHWRQFFDKFKDEAARLEIFQSQKSLGRRVEKLQNRLDELQAKIDEIEGVPAPERAGDIAALIDRKALDSNDIDQLSDILGEIPDDVSRMSVDDVLTRLSDEAEEILEASKVRDTAKSKELAKRIDRLTNMRERLVNIQREAANEAAPKPKVTGLQRSLLKTYKKDYDRVLLDMDRAQQQADWMKGMEGKGDWLDPDYFFRIWRPDEIKARESEFKGILRTHFTKNPYGYQRGKRVKYSEDPADIEARVDKAYNNIVREADYDDPFGMIDPEARQNEIEARIEELNDELTRQKPKSREAYAIQRKIKLYEKMLENPEGLAKIMPAPLRSRQLDIHNKEVFDFIQTDVEHVAHAYLRKMAPVIEITRNFGEKSMTDFRAPLNMALGERIAKARSEGNEKLAVALEKEQVKLNKSVDDLRDIVLGVYGISKNPAHWTGRATRLMTAWMNLVGMGKAVMVALNDIGNYIGYVGFRRALGDGWRYTLARARKDASEWNMGRDEALWAGDAYDIMSSQRAIALTDIGGLGAVNRFERAVQKNQQRMFIFNLLTPWTDFMEGMNGAMAQSAIIRDAVAMAAGKLSKSRMSELTKLGMTRRMAKKISDQWHKIPEADRKGRHILLANSDKWDDVEAQRAFRAMLSTEIANLVPAPKAADKPTFMHKNWGRIMFQYKGFSFAATSRIMMANLQRRDQRALSTVMSMIGMSYLIDMAKSPDYISLDIEDQLFRAVEISGVTGIFSDVNQAIEGVTGNEYGVRPMLGLESFERDVNYQTRFGAIAGASPNLFSSFAWAMLSDDADTADKARAVRYMIPYNNMIHWSWFVDRLQRDTVDLLE